VITNFNYAAFLPRSIDSALAQDWSNKEIVVVDDCSTDHSREVIGGYGNRVIPVLQPQNRGHGAAMNAGFLKSTGDIVIFLDADDYLYPTALRRIVESRSPETAQYQYRLDLLGADGKVIDTYPPKEFRWDDGDVTEALLTRGRYATTVTSGLAFSRSALDHIMPMDEEAFRMGGDGYLVTVAPFYGRVVTIAEILGAYHQHGGNHSQFAADMVRRARWRMDHDMMRYQALTNHARRQSKSPRPDLWRNDPLHLEGRMASLLFEPSEHPHSHDTRQAIARCGLTACRSLPMSRRRRGIMRLGWWIVGWGPLPLARSALRWKLQAESRPAIVKQLAKILRAAAG
jgi:glycosyltransferase involved in cell wall biosynthesis